MGSRVAIPTPWSEPWCSLFQLGRGKWSRCEWWDIDGFWFRGIEIEWCTASRAGLARGGWGRQVSWSFGAGFSLSIPRMENWPLLLRILPTKRLHDSWQSRDHQPGQSSYACCSCDMFCLFGKRMHMTASVWEGGNLFGICTTTLSCGAENQGNQCATEVRTVPRNMPSLAYFPVRNACWSHLR